LPLQFAALFIMTLSMENELTVTQAFMHTGLFLAGGLAYLAYAMLVAWFLRPRIKQQVLAEALFELARYIQIKADFYDMHTNLQAQFNHLVRQQIVLADKQQASRDLILRGRPGARDAVLIQVHYGMIDLYETILSTHTDYALLRRHFADTDVLNRLHELIRKAAHDLESIAFAVTRKRASTASVSYEAEFLAVEAVLQQLQTAYAHEDNLMPGMPDEAMIVLRTSYNKVREVIDMIGQLHLASQTPVGPLPVLPEADMTPFLTQQKYELGLLISSLNLRSSVFRFALRVAMAISVGLLVADHLPYASHGYWIVLTIVIILKPSYSMTKQRRGDRLLGTTIGCALTALILHLVHAPLALLGFLFLATVAVPSFVYIKYRYTAIAASMQILLQINLMIPNSTGVIGERLLDTLIGAVIATAFSFVLPSWEYRALPRLIKSVLQANRRYIEATRDLLQSGGRDDLPYRLCRKRFMDCVAALSATLVRMLDEPASKQYAVEELNLFIVENYLVVSHVAAIRLLLRRHAEGLPKESVDGILQQVSARIGKMLDQAQRLLDNPPPLQSETAEIKPSHDDVTGRFAGTEHAGWSGWQLLQRRCKMLQADADKIVARSAALGRELQVVRQQV